MSAMVQRSAAKKRWVWRCFSITPSAWYPFSIQSSSACHCSSRPPLTMVKGGRELQWHALEDWMEKGYQALGVMEKHLQTHRFFAADRCTIADIAVYAYTHVAHESDFDLTGFPAIRAWLKRVAGDAGHIPMEWHPAVAIAE